MEHGEQPVCNPSPGEVRAEERELETNPSYQTRPCLSRRAGSQKQSHRTGLGMITRESGDRKIMGSKPAWALWGKERRLKMSKGDENLAEDGVT